MNTCELTTHAREPHSLRLGFVTCVSSLDTLQAQLLRSPCLQAGGLPLSAHFNATSAAQAFNATADTSQVDWLVWIHQDVFLPADWTDQFMQQLQQAIELWPELAVAGVYGIGGRGADARHAGHVLDRGALLRPDTPLPCPADSLDELLVAVRVSSRLRMDPQLGFDFYGTDLVLQAQAQGLACVVLDACCEHWSDTPTMAPFPAGLVRRVSASAEVFEAKWRHRLPIHTSCFSITQPGDVKAFMDRL